MRDLNPFQQRQAQRLTYAGILPPWIALGVGQVISVAWLGHAALTYGAVIASFICGMHWATFTHGTAPADGRLLLTSNAGALAAWAMVLLAIWSMPLALVGLVGVLAALLFLDRQLLAEGTIAPWFFALRRNATIGLGASLLVWAALA
jgi:hypothetical protein